MNRRRVLLLAAFAAALGIRLIPIPRVFTIAYVNFQGDSWYHMRRVDALVTDLTQGITSDPYAANQFIAIAPLLDLIMAALVRVFGGGADAMRADMVAALVPPLLGAAVVFPVFGIARRAFGDVAGIWAAFSVALLPGTFLQRSIVGYTDHHVLEVLTTTLAAWALVEAGTRRGAASLAWGVLGGVFVGCYNLSWSGAAFFSGALMLWLALDAATRLLHPDADSMTVPKAFAAAASVGWLMVAALQNPGLPRASMQRAALAATAGLSISLWILGRAVQGFRKSRPALVVLLLAGAGLGILLLARQTPNLGAVIDQASVILRGQGSAEVAETKPLGDVFPNEPLRGVVLFGGTGLFGLLAWPIVAARLLRLPNLGSAFVVSFSLMALSATWGQNRFGYYATVPLALLSGFFLDAATTGIARATASRFSRMSGLAIPLVAAIFFVPNAGLVRAWLSMDEGMPVGWHQAASWLRRNATEVFDDPSVYSRPTRAVAPEPRHRVLAWWDYGYWVGRVGRQVAIAYPTQAGAGLAGSLLAGSFTERTARQLEDSKIRYLVLGDGVPFRLSSDPNQINGIFTGMLDHAGLNRTDFVESLFERRDGRLHPVWVFKAPYFQALTTHLYLFDGAPVRAETVWVFPFSVVAGAEGKTVREIEGARQFGSFEEARKFHESLPPGTSVMGSRDPLKTGVDLVALDRFKLRYESTDRDVGELSRPRAKVFEFVR